MTSILNTISCTPIPGPSYNCHGVGKVPTSYRDEYAVFTSTGATSLYVGKVVCGNNAVLTNVCKSTQLRYFNLKLGTFP